MCLDSESPGCTMQRLLHPIMFGHAGVDVAVLVPLGRGHIYMRDTLKRALPQRGLELRRWCGRQAGGACRCILGCF